MKKNKKVRLLKDLYLVSIGLLLVVLTVYYPLKERQELEIIKIQLEKDVMSLNYKIKENEKNVKALYLDIKKSGYTLDKQKVLDSLDKLNQENNINQIAAEKKISEIKVRTYYISLYQYIFWVFFPLGVLISGFGFLNWRYSGDTPKKDEDKRIHMNDLELITSSVDEIIDTLCNRGGFDDWWGNIDTDIRNEIKGELEDIIKRKTNA